MAIRNSIKSCVKPMHIHIYALDKKVLFQPPSRATVKDLLDAEMQKKIYGCQYVILFGIEVIIYVSRTCDFSWNLHEMQKMPI